jgi:hypothetical protein
MHTRTLLNAGVFVLLLVLTIEVAGMSRSLRRIEHEERRLVTHCVAERPMTWFRAYADPAVQHDSRFLPENVAGFSVQAGDPRNWSRARERTKLRP